MSSPTNGQSILFEVICSGQVMNNLKELQLQATQAGKGETFLAALQAIRLRKAPRYFGEPLYRLPSLKLLVHVGVIFPLVVDFAVHDELPLVFIKGIKDLTNL